MLILSILPGTVQMKKSDSISPRHAATSESHTVLPAHSGSTAASDVIRG